MKKTITIENYEAWLLDYSEGILSDAEVKILFAFLKENPRLYPGDMPDDLPQLQPDAIETDFKQGMLKTGSDLDIGMLEFLEGIMNETEEKRFLEKLSRDRGLQDELNQFRKAVLVAGAHKFPGGKQLLHKHDYYFEGDVRLLSYAEGLMSHEEKAAYEELISGDAKLYAELELFRLTRLEPDAEMVFPGKEKLRWKNLIVPLGWGRAGLLLAAGLLITAGMIFIYNKFLKEDLHVPSIDKVASVTKIEKPAVAAETIQEKGEKEIAANAVEPEKPIVRASTGNKSGSNVIKNEHVPSEKNERAPEEAPLLTAGVTPEVKSGPVNVPTELETVAAETMTAVVMPSSLPVDNSFIVYEEEDNDDETEAPAKRNFWSRAVRLAAQVNKMGFKTVNGEKLDDDRTRLSLFALSVEKN